MSVTEAKIRDLLAFWVNATLSGEDHDRVALAPQSSVALRAEVAALAALRKRMQEVPMPASPGALGLARLMRAIEALPARQVPRWQGARLVAATAAVAAVLSSVLTFAQIDSGTNGGDPVYEQASGDDPGAALTVTFRPEASEAAISALLRERGLAIVDGPSALGLYRIALPYDTDPAEVASYLEAASGVIATVKQAE